MKDKDLRRLIGKTLREGRFQWNMTQEELGKHLRKSRQTIIETEAGRTMPSFAFMVEASEVLGFSLDSFANRGKI